MRRESSQDTPFPRDYFEKVRHIFRRLFRVYAHVYYRCLFLSFFSDSHMTLINRLGLTNQFQFSLTHFLFFVNQFQLVSPSDLRPLKDLVNKLAPNLKCACASPPSLLVTKEMNEISESRARLHLSSTRPQDSSQGSHSFTQSSSPANHSSGIQSQQSSSTQQSLNEAFHDAVPPMTREFLLATEGSVPLFNGRLASASQSQDAEGEMSSQASSHYPLSPGQAGLSPYLQDEEAFRLRRRCAGVA